jgi:hypothetical protein
LACEDIDGLKRITLVEFEIHRGGAFDESVVFKATDVFAARSEGPDRRIPPGGLLRTARFELEFANDEIVRELTIALPDKAVFQPDCDGRLIKIWLRREGFVVTDASIQPTALGTAA